MYIATATSGYTAQHEKWFVEGAKKLMFKLMTAGKPCHFLADVAKVLTDTSKGNGDGKDDGESKPGSMAEGVVRNQSAGVAREGARAREEARVAARERMRATRVMQARKMVRMTSTQKSWTATWYNV